MRIYMGRRYRENAAAMRDALAENKEKGAHAMQEALAQIAAAGASVGKPTPPCVPGRIRARIAKPAPRRPDPLVENILKAMPAATVVATPGPTKPPPLYTFDPKVFGLRDTRKEV